MEILAKSLPKDLINIVEDYAKDRSKYDQVLTQFELFRNEVIEDDCADESEFCIERGCSYHSCCSHLSFKDMENQYPECYKKHMIVLNELVNNNAAFFSTCFKHVCKRGRHARKTKKKQKRQANTQNWWC